MSLTHSLPVSDIFTSDINQFHPSESLEEVLFFFEQKTPKFAFAQNSVWPWFTFTLKAQQGDLMIWQLQTE